MDDRPKQSSIHFQLLIAGTTLFLLVFFWATLPADFPNGTIKPETGLPAIAVYIAFVVIVGGHALLEKRRDPPSKSEPNGDNSQ